MSKSERTWRASQTGRREFVVDRERSVRRTAGRDSEFGWHRSPGDDTVDSDAAPATGESAPFNVSINLLDTTIDAGLVVVPPFVDGFETGNTTRWSATVP